MDRALKEREKEPEHDLWHHGTRIATGSKGSYKTTGWVKASAFCS